MQSKSRIKGWGCVVLLSLAACGGGGGSGAGGSGQSGASNPSNEAPVAPAPVSAETAARFLTQSTFGPTSSEITQVASSGPELWMSRQFALPATSHLAAVPVIDNTVVAQFIGQFPLASSFWTQAATSPDQLRQRTTFALSQIFVISMLDMNVMGYPQGIADYMDTLSRNAFGNYRQLLEEVTLHPMMGLYLSHLGNQKEDPATGRQPDENFAREVLQLFSIGLVALNPDGTPRRDARGELVETYTNEDVMGLAKVFTGWSWSAADKTAANFQPFQGYEVKDGRAKRLMEPYPEFHSSAEKRFLGKTIAANTDARESLKQALDHLFNHPNVGPFIGKQMIQRFVTSNPSPAYVSRVSAAFNDNGRGVRGDMKALMRAVLLDPEARDPARAADPGFGKLREPVLRLSAWMRAFDVKSRSNSYSVIGTDDPNSGIGQAPLRAPSVFNFYRPGYVPPNTATAAAGLVAPEMQITSETSVASYVNFVQNTAVLQSAGFLLDLYTEHTAEKALAGDVEALIAHMDLLMTGGNMEPQTKALMREALNSVPQGAFDWQNNRVRLALMFTLNAPEFIVQR